MATLILVQAAAFAADAHRLKTRKSDGSSYICHPLEVALFLCERCGVEDTNVLAAAMLHDTVEDHGDRVSILGIRDRFGENVASIVFEVTDDRELAQVERKRAQVEHVKAMSRDAKLVKAADMWHNLSSLRANPPKGWTEDRVRGYAAWKKLIFLQGDFQDLHPTIESELNAVFSSLLADEDERPFVLKDAVEAYYALLLLEREPASK